jgi:hypothetical protein
MGFGTERQAATAPPVSKIESAAFAPVIEKALLRLWLVEVELACVAMDYGVLTSIES